MGVSLCDLVKKISMILGVGVRGSKRKPSTFRPARRKKKAHRGRFAGPPGRCLAALGFPTV